MAGIPKSQRTPELRFWSKVAQTDVPDACWLWTASLSKGYGQFRVGKRLQMAHLWAYEALVGSIPAGSDLDHLCHTQDTSCVGGGDCAHRRCVNPAHLEPVSRRENLLRGRTITAANAAKTHCLRGHAFTPENTWMSSDGARYCRACFRVRKQLAA